MSKTMSGVGVATASAPSPAITNQPLAYRLDGACAALNVSRSHLYRLVQRGQLKVRNVAGVKLVMREDLERLLRGGDGRRAA